MTKTKEDQNNKTSEPSKALKEFLREQRTNPYYVVFTVLFAAVVALIASWIAKITDSLLPHPNNVNSTLLGRLIQHFKLNVTISNETPIFQLPIWQQLLVAILVFWLAVYLWLFFSRILVFVKETSGGEAMSFLLLFLILGGVAILPSVPRLWGFVLGSLAAVVSAKMFQVYVSLRKQANHPIRKNGGRWTRYSLIVTAITILLTALFNPSLWSNPSVDILNLERVYSVFLALGACGGVAIVTFVFPRIESALVNQMNPFMDSDSLPTEIPNEKQ